MTQHNFVSIFLASSKEPRHISFYLWFWLFFFLSYLQWIIGRFCTLESWPFPLPPHLCSSTLSWVPISVYTCPLLSVPHEAIICEGVKLSTLFYTNCPVVIFTLRVKINSVPSSQALRHQAPAGHHSANQDVPSGLGAGCALYLEYGHHLCSSLNITAFYFCISHSVLHCLTFTG